MQMPIDTHTALAEAIGPLTLLGSFKHPATHPHLQHVALALQAVRRMLETRAQAVAMARLRAVGVTVSRLAHVADRLPSGPLFGVLTEQHRSAAQWAGAMLEYGWHGLAPSLKVAHGMGIDREQAAAIPTLAWIASGRVPHYPTQEWRVLGGVIDAPLLQALCDFGKSDQSTARCPIFAGSYQDTMYQIESMAEVLLALDLRLQECAWMLARLSERLDPLGGSVLSVLGTLGATTDDRPSAERVPASFGTFQQCQMRAGCAALLRLAFVELVDATGALSAQGHDAVVAARRLLANDLIAPLTTGRVSC